MPVQSALGYKTLADDAKDDAAQVSGLLRGGMR